MAHKTMYVTEAGAQHYRTRMMQAGDPITLSGPERRLQIALGHISGNPPRRAARSVEEPEPAPATETVTPAPKKAAPRRKKAPAKK